MPQLLQDMLTVSLLMHQERSFRHTCCGNIGVSQSDQRSTLFQFCATNSAIEGSARLDDMKS